MTPKKYKSLPVEVEAIQFVGSNWQDIEKRIKEIKPSVSVKRMPDCDGLILVDTYHHQSMMLTDYLVFHGNALIVLEKEVFEKKYREVGE